MRLKRRANSSPCAGYLGHPFRKIGIVHMIERASLPRDVRFEYNQQGSFCSSSLTTCLFSRRRSSIGVWCVYLNQTTSLFQLTYAPKTFFALDKATNDFTFARNICRYVQRKIRTACGKRTVTTTTDHSSATDQTTDIQEAGSAPLDTSDQDGPNKGFSSKYQYRQCRLHLCTTRVTG